MAVAGAEEEEESEQGGESAELTGDRWRHGRGSSGERRRPPTLIPKCWHDYHAWGAEVGCPPPLDGQCNAWCQNRCSGGACKISGGKRYCHCNCH
uniref:Uncharacterized protein n=1 Tax=Oryza punctata TaxID=4537 RepID=A0A0E0LB98_ORYPU